MGQLGWSFPIARIAGTTIYVHSTFALLIGYMLLKRETLPVDSIELSLLLLVVGFACVALHELGHSFAARMCGIPVESIVLWPFGGIAHLTREPEKPHHELFISAAGPLVNFMIAIATTIVYVIVALVSGSVPKAESLERFSFASLIVWIILINMLMAVFNLIPALPLDGGRMLRSALLMRVPRAQTSEVMKISGFVSASVTGIIGIALWDFFLIYVAVIMVVSATDPLPKEAENRLHANESPKPPDAPVVAAEEHTAFSQLSRPMLAASAVPAAEAPVLHMTKPRDNRYKTGPLYESQLERDEQPVARNNPNASSAVMVDFLGVMNLVIAGLIFLGWALVCAALLYDIFFSEIDRDTVIAVSLFLVLPGLIVFLLFLTAAIGLLRSRVWGYYTQLAIAILLAFTIVGLIYAIPALIVMFKPAFRERFFPYQYH